MLTSKNRQAIDLYLSADPECSGNGSQSWKRIYGTKNAQAAGANWQRMLKKAEAREYLERRQAELSERVAREFVIDRKQIVQDLVRIQRDAMQLVNQGKVARKIKHKDPETGEEVEKIEYAPVMAMVSHSDAIRASEAALRAMGDHPDQRTQGAGVIVNIQIDTQWRGIPGTDPIDVTGTPDEPPEFEEEPPRVVIIGRK